MKMAQRPVRNAIILGVLGGALALGFLGAIVFGSSAVRFSAALGLIMLLVAAQIVFLFVRPTDRTPFGQARQAFVASDYPMAAQLLESIAAQRPTVRTLTLLGNTYRQMGRYQAADEQLERARTLSPRNANVMYALGRVSLAQGDFEAAAEWFDSALAAGAPAAIACDLGLAEYCAGHGDSALRTFQKATRVLQIEPHRLWLASALMYVILSTPPRYEVESSKVDEVLQANLSRTAAGRAYWEAEAARHNATPYGAALHAAVTAFDQICASKGK